jgi:hypothetical protein
MKNVHSLIYVTGIQRIPTLHSISTGKITRKWEISFSSYKCFDEIDLGNKILEEKELIKFYAKNPNHIFDNTVHKKLSISVFPNKQVVVKMEQLSLGKITVTYYFNGIYFKKRIRFHELENFLNSSDVVYNQPGITERFT